MQVDIKKTKRGRGRPKAYDPEEAMNNVMQQFWSQGYSATSLDDLSAATGMNRPSLYAAFGNKQSIYLKSLEFFAAEMARKILRALSRPGTLHESLVRFYSNVLDVYFSGDQGARGCSVWCTATVEAHRDPVIREFLVSAIARIDGALQQRFEQAVSDGELDPGADPKILGQLAAATMHSIALRARAGASRASLRKLTSATAGLLSQNALPKLNP